ncbi:hypothetical protein ACSNN7_10000 [Micromonospora sp. URMC 105]|uniref:hypothetical protein n=1 Tax=Micromonospora sp. URMC 105 TaxID=3423413 RepID=UPI003F1D0348
MALDFETYTSLGSPEVIWSTDANEWLHRLRSALPELAADLSGAGILYDSTTQPFIKVTAVTNEGTAKDAPLLIAPLIDGRIALFVGHRGSDDEMIEIWRRVTDYATANLGQEGDLHEWSAVLGPPATRVGGMEVSLLKPGEVGPFRLASADRPLREGSFSVGMPSFHGMSSDLSWPILARGSHRGYSWQSTSKKAARELNQLCALLSVAWDTCLVIRESPAPMDWGERLPPEKIFWQEIPTLSDEVPRPEPTSGREIPNWSEAGWARITKTPRLADAVSAHHEGLRAQVEHPSLALVAFIASIEAISQLLYREDRCNTCKGHLHISAKFRQTLRLVLDEEEAAELGTAYSSRSLTVHRGRLHGTETTIGALNTGLWSFDSASEFQWQVLYKMNRASASLLKIAIQGQLPGKTRFELGPDH